MRHQLSPLHLSQGEGLWVQGDMTDFSGSGPGPSPRASYLGGGGGSTFPGRQQGRIPPGRYFTTGHDFTLSLHCGDECHHLSTRSYFLSLTIPREELIILLGPKGEEKEKNSGNPNLLGSSLPSNPGVLIPLFLRSDSLVSQKIPTVAKPDTVLYQPDLKSFSLSHLSARALPIPPSCC